VDGRRTVACVAFGLGGIGLGTGAALRAGEPTSRLLALVAGLCAGGAGLVGWLAHPAEAGDEGVGESFRAEWMARAQRREADLRERLAAAERAVSDSNADTVLSVRAPREGEVLIDPLTGLYSESYLLVALEARIAAARRRLRPVSVVMIEVVTGLASGRPRPADPEMVAAAVRSTLREADTASHTADDRYVLVLEDTAENGAIWSVERLRSRLLSEFPDHTLWAGVACYPAHAFNLDEILHRATIALEAAKEWHQDRIEVATAE
jgi:two-component system cell cycle response regulator